MVALEKVHSLDEFLAHAKTRIHWFIRSYTLHLGYFNCRISVWLTGLDDKGNMVKFSKYIGNSGEGEYEERKRKFEALVIKAEKYIDDVVPHATEGLWEISR